MIDLSALHHQKILVVEDSPSQRLMISQHLRRWRYDVAEAADGAEALALFKSDGPSIVVTDLEMPVMDGFRLIEEIRKVEASRTYIIVLSATEAKRMVVTALALGADDYLGKPYHPDELRVRLAGAEALEGHPLNP